MGVYNPHTPYILGEEWVPIREEDLTFSPSVNSVELGHSYTLTSPQRIRDARFYANELPASPPLYHTAMFATYPVGQEALTGPIREVIIPVNATAGITGTNLTFEGGSSAAEVLQNPGDFKSLHAAYNSGNQQTISLFFAVNAYPVLTGKRILNVSLVYTGYAVHNNLSTGRSEPFVDDDPTSGATMVAIRNDAGVSQFYQTVLDANTGALTLNTVINPASGVASSDQVIKTLDLGDVNHFWSTTLGPSGTTDRMPWRYSDLQRFEASASNRLFVYLLFQVPANEDHIRVEYAALRVQYCEETRIAYGGRLMRYGFGVNAIVQRDLSHNTDPVLAAGQYTTTLSFVSPGDVDFGFGLHSEFAHLNALRELYDIPPHPGVQVNIPFPLADHYGETFTMQQTHILPHISLHTSGGPLTDVHVYGRQAAAQVYSTIIASQEILETGAGGNSWAQVRYYARRYGSTTVPLLLFSPDGPISGAANQVQITPGEWDVLPEIIDRWKEITLRFSTPPVMPTGQTRWRWSATGELIGNRWEVMGAIAPAISGIPGNLLNKVPAPHQLSIATYGAPTQGDTTNLGWVPGYSPFVTSVTDDQTADAVLMFSQDPPTITGFAVGLQSQAITGFTECAHGPCCLPSALQYHRVTWSPTTLPTTGFGGYELQRLDTIDATWQTIMLATSPAVTGFNDYEARVGVLSSYQIRQLNVLDFAGLWSVTGTGTITAPGVTMPSCGSSKRGVLIFTSNESQVGAYNLAYAMTWTDEPVESFDFPETNDVQITTQHDRDYQVAFHGSERGGETFTRRLLLANAAVALPRLANVRSLRDMGWADVPYVCVRDDIGDRWFAAVIVPHSETRRNRRLYNAEITVIEVTATPSPVDP